MNDPKLLTRAALRDFPLPPVADGDKNDHGRLFIVAGSRQVPGSALLCGRSALRSGAGKVRIATVESVAPAMAMKMVEAFVLALPEDEEGGCDRSAAAIVAKEAGSADAIVAGPGMADGKVSSEIALAILKSGTPAILDAGLLYTLADIVDECRTSDIPLILLPHERELAALLEWPAEAVEADRLAAAREAASCYDAIVLAKGADSHVVTPCGRAWTYCGGAPGLGVAGSGDALSGIVGALLARGAEPLAALLWGVLLHGEAGEMLSAKVGPVGFLAREIPEEIPALLAR